MSKFEKSIEEIFDVTPFQGNPNIDKDKQVTLTPAPRLNDLEPDLKGDLVDAYEQSRTNLQDLIDNGRDAMEELLQIAREGQHPRAFEVYSGLLKNMVDANKELLTIQKQMRDMDNNKQKAGDTKIDKAIFVGTAADLNKLLKDDS
jgi:hypothetical protein